MEFDARLALQAAQVRAHQDGADEVVTLNDIMGILGAGIVPDAPKAEPKPERTGCIPCPNCGMDIPRILIEPKPVVRESGQHYMLHGLYGPDVEYVLAAASSRGLAVLINIGTGNRYGGGAEVRDHHKISDAEWKRITNGNMAGFILLEEGE